MSDARPDLPTADITALRTVVRDGWYNAFTDLALWKDMYWLCYRRGTSHVAGNSVEVVLRSDDLRRWRPVIDFESPAGVADGCAAADGHFCTTPDRLYLFIGTRNPIHSYVSWTDDGVHWSQPALLSLGDDHPYTWRVRWREGLFYSAICHLHHEERPFELIVSERRHPLDPTGRNRHPRRTAGVHRRVGTLLAARWRIVVHRPRQQRLNVLVSIALYVLGRGRLAGQNAPDLQDCRQGVPSRPRPPCRTCRQGVPIYYLTKATQPVICSAHGVATPLSGLAARQAGDLVRLPGAESWRRSDPVPRRRMGIGVGNGTATGHIIIMGFVYYFSPKWQGRTAESQVCPS